MTITVEATYKNGVLKPKEPLQLTEGTEVRLAISPLDEAHDPLAAVIGIGDSGRTDGADNHDKYLGLVSPLLAAHGIMGWQGTSAELDRLLAEIEFDEDEVP